MTSRAGPDPERHRCWPGIKAAVPFLTLPGPRLTPSLCSRHFIVCPGHKQNPAPESRKDAFGGALARPRQISVVTTRGPP